MVFLFVENIHVDQLDGQVGIRALVNSFVLF